MEWRSRAGEKSAERESPSASSSGSSQSLIFLMISLRLGMYQVPIGSFSPTIFIDPLGGALKEHSLKAHQASSFSILRGRTSSLSAAPDADFIGPASLPEKGRGVGSVFTGIRDRIEWPRNSGLKGRKLKAKQEEVHPDVFPVGKLFHPSLRFPAGRMLPLKISPLLKMPISNLRRCAVRG